MKILLANISWMAIAPDHTIHEILQGALHYNLFNYNTDNSEYKTVELLINKIKKTNSRRYASAHF